MNFSLTHILQIADEIHENILKEENSITISDYINSIHKLRAYIEQIKIITNRIENIYRICLNKIENCILFDKKIVDEKQDPKILNIENYNTHFSNDIINKINKPYSNLFKNIVYTLQNKKEDLFTIISIKNFKYKSAMYISNNLIYIENNKKINCQHNINYKIAKNINDVPNINLYKVDNKYVLKINDIIIKGNIGNIYGTFDKNKMIKVYDCKYKNCNKLDKCSYYHINDNRNFTNSSWIYTPDEYNKKNKYMRHVGNGSTLESDIYKLLKYDKKIVKNEINTLTNQIMHDILVLITLNQKYIFN